MGADLKEVQLDYVRSDAPDMEPKAPRWPLLLAVALLLLTMLAACFDMSVASWVHRKNLQPTMKKSVVAAVVKLPGNFLKGTLPIAALALIVGGRRRGGYAVAMILISGALAGLIYTLAKWSAGRIRPYSHSDSAHPFDFHPFADGIRGLWAANNQAFPSGHTCLAFATATSLAILWPRAWPLFFIWAILTGFERVLENAHYPSDAVAGALFGVLAAWMAQLIMRRLTASAKATLGAAHE